MFTAEIMKYADLLLVSVSVNRKKLKTLIDYGATRSFSILEPQILNFSDKNY